ncbi:MAG: exonuclease SbcCD subunit D [Actinomyces sp.]|uniref:exonuclease SbcCD subunit D n=1 Tax=Actinomyces sp. TaxID=29317 RepID=UPI0026DC9E58|nr:exonuclease SbcCD subunit D [Actinomyces sp.]MDO4242284.1 exonuclease SbcCD subunit D [Actinomyces sp.]
MRILHTSDWHLGRTFHGRVLDEAQAAVADHLVDLARSESVDAVVISGDVYDRAIPPTDSVRLLDDTLRRLSDRTRVILTPGNHDSAQRLGFGSSLLRESLTIRARIAEVDSAVVIPDSEGSAGLYIYALPYLDPDAARHALPPLLSDRLGEAPDRRTPTASDDGEGPSPNSTDTDAAPGSGTEPTRLLARSHEAVVSGALRLIAKDLAGRRAGASTRVPALVMSHAFVVGGQTSPDSERDIRVGGVDSVPAGAFTTLGGSPLATASGGIDYVALGHLHRPQELRVPTVAHAPAPPRLVYSGSPLPLSFPEAQTPKSTVILEVGADGVTGLERVAAPRPYRATTLRGTLEELLGPTHAEHTDHWVRIELTGPMPPDAMARLKERFPDLLAFSHIPPERPERESLTITRTSDPLEITDRFLTQMLGRPPAGAEQRVVAAAYDAARAGQTGEH